VNYRHAFHAGNFADVFKHLLIIRLMEDLQRKEKPMFFLDTHAGAGRYDLTGYNAGRTDEWRSGVGRLIAADDVPGDIARYLARLGQSGPRLRWYPGSPLLAQKLLREGDRAAVCELQPDDAVALQALLRDDPRLAVHRRDGYEALKAFLPPRERRGLTLIDPPFERRDEFEAMVRGLRTAHRRFPTGIYALWYPVKDVHAVSRFRRALGNGRIRRVLDVRMSPLPEDVPGRFNGCGMIVVNPPWGFDDWATELLPRLTELLCEPPGGGRQSVDWLVGE